MTRGAPSQPDGHADAGVVESTRRRVDSTRAALTRRAPRRARGRPLFLVKSKIVFTTHTHTHTRMHARTSATSATAHAPGQGGRRGGGGRDGRVPPKTESGRCAPSDPATPSAPNARHREGRHRPTCHGRKLCLLRHCGTHHSHGQPLRSPSTARPTPGRHPGSARAPRHARSAHAHHACTTRTRTTCTRHAHDMKMDMDPSRTCDLPRAPHEGKVR